jgi:hypothetical protein
VGEEVIRVGPADQSDAENRYYLGLLESWEGRLGDLLDVRRHLKMSRETLEERYCDVRVIHRVNRSSEIWEADRGGEEEDNIAGQGSPGKVATSDKGGSKCLIRVALRCLEARGISYYEQE